MYPVGKKYPPVEHKQSVNTVYQPTIFILLAFNSGLNTFRFGVTVFYSLAVGSIRLLLWFLSYKGEGIFEYTYNSTTGLIRLLTYALYRKHLKTDTLTTGVKKHLAYLFNEMKCRIEV